MTYNPLFRRPTESEVENATTTLEIIEETAKLCGLLARAVMETTKDEHQAEKWIVDAVTKAEKQIAAIGFENTADLKDALESIRCCLIDWNAGDEAAVEQAVSEHFLTAIKAAERVEEEAPSHDEEMRREHGTHY